MSSIVDIHKKNGVRPDFDIYIGRRVGYTEFTKGSKWRNPFTRWKHGDDVLKLYEENIIAKIVTEPEKYNLNELKGKKLGCWCITTDKIEPLVCHGQILLKLLRIKEAEE